MGNLLFVTTFIISVLYYWSVRSRLLAKVSPHHTQEGHPYERGDETYSGARSVKVSAIVPARNEEANLPKLLSSLLLQTIELHEIIVVDDNSSDRTKEIVRAFAEKHSSVKLYSLREEPPEGWVGKSWAIWNGVQRSTGDVLVFFDADVEPEPSAVEVLLDVHRKFGGLISVWPYQRFEKFYEHLGLFGNLMAIYASNYFEFAGLKPSGAFGPVIVTSRKDYFETGGHNAVRDSVLEDVKLGKLYVKLGLPVKNFLGRDVIKFRMYPKGVSQLFEGFSKNMGAGAVTGGPFAFLLAFIWMAGMSSALAYVFSPKFLWKYLVHVLQVYVLAKPTGDYRIYDALLYPVHLLFFLVVFFASLYRTLFVRKVKWKGREIGVG